VRRKTFLWEGVLYHANYNHIGLLKKLDAVEKDIVFYYNEDHKLYKAEIILTGAIAPESVFDFIQSPHGITKITWTQSGIIKHIIDFTYGIDGELTNLLNSHEGSTDPYNQHNLDIAYVNNNVPYLLNAINGNPFTQMDADGFDYHKSPFKMLARSVGNPSFFPVGSFVFFQIPVTENNIPYISWLSSNNPTHLRYSTAISGGFIEEQPLTYSYYPHGLVKEIIWENELAGTPTGSPYVFQFDYEYH
jgi:hypothetical protein